MIKETLQLQVSPALISLDGYYIQELGFSLNVEHALTDEFYLCTGSLPQRKNPMKAPQLIYDVTFNTSSHKDDPSRFKCMLTLESSERDMSDEAEWYKFKVTIGAFFTIHESVKITEEREIFYQQNAVTIIYSLAREVLASATSRSLFPGIVLPTVLFGFNDPAKDFETEKKKEKAKLKGSGNRKELPEKVS